MPARSPELDSRSVGDPDRLDDLIADVLLRRERGEVDALEEVCREHPADEPELRVRVARLDAMRPALAALDRAGPGAAAVERFGHHRILRELGRGGMGVVYLARDERLGRDVALKAMTSPALAGARGRARFEREVRVVASLDHPGIVPVFEASEQDGMPYFTMQYVEGRSLSDVLDALREDGTAPQQLRIEAIDRAADLEPDGGRGSATSVDGLSTRGGPRWRSHLEFAARVALDVAEALAHAHAHGVVHRDVKPSNLMLRRSGAAMLLDFGLAHVDSGDAVTRSGQLVGTPHYLSPEQALGDPAAVDARTDVYSLGVTLYELLTLRVPFEGGSSPELLNRIVTADPTPPRRLNPAVPRDLETVCLTALAKDPGHRYASARDMAEDLRRYLEGRPLVARPVGPVTRALRWSRRNPALGAVAALVFLVVVVGPLVFGVHSSLARTRLAGEQAATERQRQLAEARAIEAELAGDRADRNLNLVLHTIDGLLNRVAQEELFQLPHMEPLRAELLERALHLYEELLVAQGDQPGLVAETARAQRRVGRVLADLGRLEEARFAADEALRVQRSVVREDGDAGPALEELGAALTLAADVRRLAGELQAADPLMEEALAVRARRAEASPDDREAQIALAGAYQELGSFALLRGQGPRAEHALREALRHYADLARGAPEESRLTRLRAQTLVNLGALLTDADRLEEGASAHREALELWRRLLVESPRGFSSRLGTLKASGNLADVLAARGESDEALVLAAETRRLAQELLAEHPDLPECAEVLAAAHVVSLRVLTAAGRLEEAAAAGETALVQLDELFARFPDRARLRNRRAMVNDALARVHESTGDADRELKALADAVAARRLVVADDPESLVQRIRLGGALNNLARAHVQAGKYGRADELIHEAIELQRGVLAVEPENAQARLFLRNHLWGLAECRLAAGDAQGTAEAARLLPGVGLPAGQEERRAAWLLARAAALPRVEPAVVEELGREALEQLARSVELGGTSRVDLEEAPDLEQLRGLPGYGALLEPDRARRER